MHGLCLRDGVSKCISMMQSNLAATQRWMVSASMMERKKHNPAICTATTEDVPDGTLAKEIRASNLAGLKCNFCKRCGNSMSIIVPQGEDELRHVCSSCGFIDYHNPRMVRTCLCGPQPALRTSFSTTNVRNRFHALALAFSGCRLRC